MNRKLILLLSVFGWLAGFATLYIPSVKGEQLAWLGVFVISTFILTRYSEGKFFLSGLVLGFADYIIAGGIHIVMYNTYINHHREIAAITEHDPATMSPRMAFFVLELMKGVFISVICGGFAFVIGNGKNGFRRQ